MARDTMVDEKSGRKCFVDYPDDLGDEEEVTFLLNLHGGGSSGHWQREYFPAYDLVGPYRLIVATPTAKTAEPSRHWHAEADDEYLVDLVEAVFSRFGLSRIRSFWLVGHSQGGATSHRLLSQDFFGDRVDGWLSLSGGRLGPAERAENFGPPYSEEERERMQAFFARRRLFEPPPPLTADFSFIYATGEHEIASLPETSPWAERYGAGARVERPDVVDAVAGKIHDGRWGDNGTKSWGRDPRPGTAKIYVFPEARDGRVIADVVRLDKGHTEGLEPKVTEELVKLVISAPGGKARALGASAAP